ncbi:unnamed protein product [Brachionus calyciflorus]|uniref:Uncharacterized protein n=1 Tax=Brachionus calyciflorus TaxID=104777 RepID=A0A813M7W4_9BILA|nr:unnamed protein product [Brachionus calyciflorus]
MDLENKVKKIFINTKPSELEKKIKMFGEIALLLISIGCVLSESIYSSLNRDGYGRQDPNSLLNGFFPAWAIILLCLAGVFLVVAIVAYGLHLLGCRKPKGEFKKVQLR